MIPTRYKSKLPKTLSWPLGAEAISAALADVPQAAGLTLGFSDSPVLWASTFQRILRERRPYAVLVARYRPALRSSYSASKERMAQGAYDEQWQLHVNPVPRPLRSAAGALLRAARIAGRRRVASISTRLGW